MDSGVDTQTYRFHDFELDLGAHQLRVRGQPVRLERRPFELLVLLATRPGQLVTRAEIVERLWPARVVIDFETGLNTLVRKVRHALGDSAENPVFIETAAGLGYRFIAPIEPAKKPAPEHEQTAAARRAPVRLSRPVAASILLLLAASVLVVIWHLSVTKPEETRIAVFPFENLTGDDKLGYLAAGIADETSTSLAQIDLPGLTVIGGVSTRALANSTAALQEIGRELGVDFVVMSSLRLEKRRIRVTSRLIRVADSEQIWTASFDRELTNVLGVQRELSIAIAEQVRQRLSPEVAAAIDRRQTHNPEAYDLYLKGRLEWYQFQPNSIPRALEYYEQAVLEDPGYALAWAGIAHALITSVVTVGASRESVLPAAEDALQRALEFGPDLAETQLALGSFHFFLDRDLPLAEAAARKAVSLDSNSAMCHMFLGIVLSEKREHVEARAMLRRARELDPLFPLMFANSAVVALHAGEPQEAVEYATQAIAINPEFWVGYLHLGNARLAQGDYSAALQAYADTDRLSGRSSPRMMSLRGYALAKLGREDEAREVLAELMSQPAGRHVPPFQIAVVHAGLGEVDAAFEWLERARADNDLWCSDVADNAQLATLQSDPRFESLMNHCRFAP